jgi:hypothetical protein
MKMAVLDTKNQINRTSTMWEVDILEVIKTTQPRATEGRNVDNSVANLVGFNWERFISI